MYLKVSQVFNEIERERIGPWPIFDMGASKQMMFALFKGSFDLLWSHVSLTVPNLALDYETF
jgi:hypothetical protein